MFVLFSYRIGADVVHAGQTDKVNTAAAVAPQALLPTMVFGRIPRGCLQGCDASAQFPLVFGMGGAFTAFAFRVFRHRVLPALDPFWHWDGCHL